MSVASEFAKIDTETRSTGNRGEIASQPSCNRKSSSVLSAVLTLFMASRKRPRRRPSCSPAVYSIESNRTLRRNRSSWLPELKLHPNRTSMSSGLCMKLQHVPLSAVTLFMPIPMLALGGKLGQSSKRKYFSYRGSSCAGDASVAGERYVNMYVSRKRRGTNNCIFSATSW